jgi:aminodeoxyfutalosine synthase
MMDISFRDERLLPVWNKVQKEERLTLQDGLILFGTTDIISLGKMAATVQQRMNGDAVYFALNQKIEPSNICVLSCRFCNFAVKADQPGAYDMSLTEILSMIKSDIREVHITGSLNPQRPWSYYLEMIRQIKEQYPQTDVKAFTAVELDFFRKKFKLSLKEILEQLKAAGLDTLPGGGAEVFSERIRRELYPQKIGAKTWLDIHKTAHRLGIRSNATLLYGHIETGEERLEHLIRLREAQDETGGFLAFIPLAFQPGSTGIKPPHEFTSAIDDLKTIAVSRLMLDNFPHIKAYWVMLTEDVAAAALNFGADDLEGTVGGEKIAHDAGATSPLSLAKERLINIIRDTGKIPVERDGFYRPLDVHAEGVVGKIPYLNSVPFYNFFAKGHFKLLPAAPRYLGLLSAKGLIIAAPFSLMDYLAQEDDLELMDYCIASFDKVRSILLFTRYPWVELEGKNIGIIDDTATSVHLLRVLLEKKYGVKANLTRMQGTNHDYQMFDAVLLIGDPALKANKAGLSGFDRVFDLATEWYEWQKMPFVFAVWAVKKSLPPGIKKNLKVALRKALAEEERNPSLLSTLHGRRIGLTQAETAAYLAGIIFRLGEAEREAIEVFRKLAIPASNKRVKRVKAKREP